MSNSNHNRIYRKLCFIKKIGLFEYYSRLASHNVDAQLKLSYINFYTLLLYMAVTYMIDMQAN